METIDLDLEKRTSNEFIIWAIMHSMVNTPGGNKNNFKDARLNNFTVELKINGVDVPFMQTLRDLKKQLDEHIEHKAKKLLLDRFGDLYDKIAEAERVIDESFSDMLKED